MITRPIICFIFLLIFWGCETAHEYESNFLHCFHESYPGVKEKMDAVQTFFVTYNILPDSTPKGYMIALSKFSEKQGIPIEITSDLARHFKELAPIPTSMECLNEDMYDEKGFKDTKFYRLMSMIDQMEHSNVRPGEFHSEKIVAIFEQSDFEHQFYRYLALMVAYGMINTEIRIDHPEKYR